MRREIEICLSFAYPLLCKSRSFFFANVSNHVQTKLKIFFILLIVAALAGASGEQSVDDRF